MIRYTWRNRTGFQRRGIERRKRVNEQKVSIFTCLLELESKAREDHCGHPCSVVGLIEAQLAASQREALGAQVIAIGDCRASELDVV